VSRTGRGPRLLRLLAWILLPERDREFIIGDLEELYAHRALRDGRGPAARRYVRDVMASALARALRRRPGRGAAPGPGRGNRPSAGSGRPAESSIGSDVLANLRDAFRTLARERGFAALTVVTLALGVGSTAAVFGMVNQLLLRPLPGAANSTSAAYVQFRSPARPEGTNGEGISTPAFDALRRDGTLFDGMASYGFLGLTVSRDDARPIAVRGQRIYGDFFEVLGVRPAVGHLLEAPETELGADPSRAVVSERLSTRLFGTSTGAVGRSIGMNGRSVTVVGVAGGGFRGPERGVEADVWLPFGALVPLFGATAEGLRRRDADLHGDIVVRLAPGARGEAAEGQVAEILGRLARDEGDPRLAELRPRLYPGLDTPPIIRAITYRSLRTLAGIVCLVLLIACANVANLLLFRNVGQRGAVATRRALGASPGRIARQQLVLSLLLGLLGTLGGLCVGWLVALPFRGAQLTRMPAFEGLVLDGRVVVFAGAVSILTALLFGTVPSFLAGRFDIVASLRQAGTRDTGRSGRIRWALSAGQLALSLSLVVGALLLARTVHNLYAADTGLSIEGVSEVFLAPPRDATPAALEALYRSVPAAVEALPDVEGAALDPYGPNGSRLLGRIGLPESTDDDALRVQMVPVTPGWFELLRLPAVSGRTFREGDWRPGESGGVVLTASLARRLFGRTDVAGRSVSAGFVDRRPMTVVGVVRDFSTAYAPDQPQDAFFVTYADAPPFHSFTLLVRTRRFDPEVAQTIRSAVEELLPDQPVPDPTPLSARVDDVHAEERIFSRLLGLLSILAVTLAAVGLYGVVAFGVVARRRELGVRLALGAEARDVASVVLGHAASIVSAGVVLGLGGAWALSHVLESRLFGVAPVDPASYVAAALLFATVAGVACWAPTRRAMRVDPAVTLREE